MTIKQYGGVFGRNPTFNNVTIEGTLTFDGDIDINSDLTIEDNLYVLGSVGIGTSVPAGLLHLASTSVALYMTDTTNNTDAVVSTDNAGSLVFNADLNNEAGSSNIRFNVDGVEAARIDASGNLLVGVQSTTLTGGSLTLPNSGIIAFHDAGGAARNVLQFVSGNIKHGAAGGGVTTQSFYTSNTLAATIDSSQNLLVGKTTDNNAIAGTAISNSGIVKATRTDWSLLLNRLTTDGDLALFQKDGANVGTIGVSGGNNTYISGSVASHSGLVFATNQILPTNAGGAGTDGLESLGSSDYRFKDLYLSGGVVFGTTGGAVTSKTLEDYEEGTWTPAYTGTTGGAVTYGTQTGSYTKVGNLVTVIGELKAKRNTLSGNVEITGLPFTNSGNGAGLSVNFASSFATDMPNLKGYTTSTKIALRKNATNTSSGTPVANTDLADAATTENYLYFSATYLT